MSEDDIIYWQDALEAVKAGRSDALTCPFCYEGVIGVTHSGMKTRLECHKCHHFIEGRFSDVDGQDS